jgi:hypothetical protein
MCQPTYRLSNAIAPEGGCTRASADCPGLNGETNVQNSSGPGRLPMSGAFLAGQAGPIGHAPHDSRCVPGHRRHAPGRPGRDGPAVSPGPPPGPSGHRPELLRFTGCGQVSHRWRPGGGGPGGPERGAAGPARAAPASRPRGGRRIRRIMEGRPEVPGLRTSTAQIARLLSIRPAMDCSDSRTRHQVAAVSGRRTIRMKSTASCHLRLSPGVTGTPWAPPAGRVRPRGRVTPGRSARCRPARAGPPAPRLRRAPGRAGRPGRTGP